MSQGKLDMVKQEMARMNINILGISELKLKGMGKYNSDNHFIYYCGQEPFRRNGVVLIVKAWEDPLEEGMETHSSILTWRIPMDRGAWWASVHGIPKNWT